MYDWRDVAGAIAKLRRPGPDGGMVPDRGLQALVLHIWIDSDEGARHWLRAAQWVASALVLPVARKQAWYPRRSRSLTDAVKRDLLRLAVLALAEKTHPAPCRYCAATGYLPGPGGAADRKCPQCSGIGARHWSAWTLARHFGRPRTTWVRTWQPRYRLVQEMIDRKERVALRKIQRILEEGASLPP